MILVHNHPSGDPTIARRYRHDEDDHHDGATRWEIASTIISSSGAPGMSASGPETDLSLV